MVYGLLADVVMVTHFAFIVFLPVGALLTWRWPRLVWVHLPTAVYGLVIITVGFTCPLTPLERSLRARAGERAFTGGFVDHYIEGALYPQRYAGLIRGLVVVLMVVGYAGLAVRLRRRAPAPPPGPACLRAPRARGDDQRSHRVGPPPPERAVRAEPGKRGEAEQRVQPGLVRVGVQRRAGSRKPRKVKS